MRVWTKAWALTASLLLTACGPGAQKTADGKPGGELRIYNWSDYIDPALLEQEAGNETLIAAFTGTVQGIKFSIIAAFPEI